MVVADVYLVAAIRSSGHALRLARWALFFAGVAKSTAKMCAAKDIVEQRRLWNTKIRPVLLSGFLTKIFFANPMFMWNALGALEPSRQLYGKIRD